MLEPALILEKLAGVFANGALAGLKVLVTAGPTHEAIDPIRFISNGSSGKMGYAMAEAAREAGADVILVSGPVALKKPQGIEVFPVVSAKAMYDAVMEKVAACDLFFAVAAVSDYAPAKIAPEKIHKKEHEITLTLKQNPDIVNSVAALTKKPFIVGFAAETENLMPQAKAKRERKHMDIIIANDVKQGFQMGSDENEVVLISARQEVTLPAMTKSKLARQLISIIADEFKRRK
jgi:phosphopantothenoylcysteine decarboxylase/phosphopantothenate--cysteine ligase